MLDLLFTTAYATGDGAATPPEPSLMGTLGSFLPLILIFVLMYFMLIRPQKKQQKQMEKMLAALAVGDKVVSIGGICGRITKIKDNYVWVETGKPTDDAQKSSIKFERSAIKSVDKKVEE